MNLNWNYIEAGATYYQKTGMDVEPDGEKKASEADAIFLGAIGLPTVRKKDGTEIAPHLRFREIFNLYAGVRPVKAYKNTPQRLSDKNAEKIDFVVLRECTEGLFYTAAVHNRNKIVNSIPKIIQWLDVLIIFYSIVQYSIYVFNVKVCLLINYKNL